MANENQKIILNPFLRDSSSKLIFGDNILCSQFLRDYADMDILRNIQPEDIEDVSERYVSLFSTERASDIVKKVNIGKYFSLKEDENPLELSLYIVSLIEHKTKVEYNVSMQILRYMIHIWEDYEKAMEKSYPHISARKGFRYPPVFPIVYYEGAERWTAPCDLADRILCKELLNDSLPHFKYQVIRLHDYSNEELLNKGDEISLAMMINKIKSPADMEAFTRLPDHQLDRILKNTPEYLLGIMADLMRALLYSMNLEEDKVENAASKIKERKMARFFEGVTYDFQAAKKEFEEFKAKVNADIAAHKAEIDAEMDAKKAEIDAKKAEVDAEKAEIDAKKAEVDAEKAEIDAKKAEVDAEKAEIDAKKAEMDAAWAEINAAGTDLKITRHIVKMLLGKHSQAEIQKSLQQEFSLSETQAEEKYRDALA